MQTRGLIRRIICDINEVETEGERIGNMKNSYGPVIVEGDFKTVSRATSQLLLGWKYFF